MAGPRKAYVDEWKARLRRQLTDAPQSTTNLSRITAVPQGSALKLLRELCNERVAVETVMPRLTAGGRAPAGWYLRKAA